MQSQHDHLPSDVGEPPTASRASVFAMFGGLIAGYGALAAILLRYLYPARSPLRRWMYVTKTVALGADETIIYRTPSGETVNITRKGPGDAPTDFVALSSICPHLGCQVHWEPQKNRYFCPCHNGVFDADGQGTSGPPGDAGQSLSRYNLRVQDGLLYIDVAIEGLASTDIDGEVIDVPPGRPGHDPCLTQLPAINRGRSA